MSANVTGDHRICFVGDSLVLGTGDSECLGWVGRMAVNARAVGWNVTHYNLGIRGDMSRDILARWKDEAERRFPVDTERYIVFSFGVNDTMMEDGVCRISWSEILGNFQKILAVSRVQYPTVMIGPPPVSDTEHNGRIQELSQSFDAVAERLDVPYLSVYDTLRQDAMWMKEVSEDDGAHPGAGGYRQLASVVSDWPQWWFGQHGKI